MTHHSEELRLGPVGGVSHGPRLLGFADDSPQLLVGEGQLVGELAGFTGLVLELAGLGLEEVIALFQRSHARSLYFTLARHPDSANNRFDPREAKWHFRARNSGYFEDDPTVEVGTAPSWLGSPAPPRRP